MELEDEKMNEYERQSKQFYMNIHTEYLAHAMHLYKNIKVSITTQSK